MTRPDEIAKIQSEIAARGDLLAQIDNAVQLAKANFRDGNVPSNLRLALLLEAAAKKIR